MNNQSLNEINKRDLDKCLFSISFSFSEIFYNDGNDYIYKRKVYFIYGCNIMGVRKYITSVFADEYTSTSSWYDFFMLLKKRGLEVIFYSIIPDEKIIKEAVSLAFPETKAFVTPLEVIKKVYKFFSQGYTTNFITKIKRIYNAVNTTDLNLKIEDFYSEYGEHPFIYDLAEKYFTYVKSYINYDYELRNNIFCFYFNRDLYKRLHTISNSRRYFFKLSEYEELLLPTIKIFETRMYLPKEDWNRIINLLYKQDKDLLLRYL